MSLPKKFLFLEHWRRWKESSAHAVISGKSKWQNYQWKENHKTVSLVTMDMKILISILAGCFQLCVTIVEGLFQGCMGR